MEAQVTPLVDKIWARLQQTPPDKRLLIGIGGMPGSGKTTLSNLITTLLNARATQDSTTTTNNNAAPNPLIAAYLPMDGFHLTRAQLSSLPDPAEAFKRRGADWTFDAAAFHAIIQRLRNDIPVSQPQPQSQNPTDQTTIPTNTSTTAPNYDQSIIYAPSFDHAIKDPKYDDIQILPTHRVVVLEGNYVLLDRVPWSQAAALLDERWFVQVEPELAKKRLVKRHVAAGIVANEEEGEVRAVSNDLPNGEVIDREKVPGVDETVVSGEDGFIIT